MEQQVVEQFARGVGLIGYAIEGLTPEELRARPGPGEWSTAQVVMHLLDSDLVATYRMKLVIAEDAPTLMAYDEQRWAARLHYEDQPVVTAVALFDLNRRQMLEILRRLDAAAFQRFGNHTERGRETLLDVVRVYANHLDHHLKFIYEKRQRLGRSVTPRYSQ